MGRNKRLETSGLRPEAADEEAETGRLRAGGRKASGKTGNGEKPENGGDSARQGRRRYNRLVKYLNERVDYSDALPFSVHEKFLVVPKPIDAPDFDFRTAEWNEDVCRLAETALERNLILSMAVPSFWHVPQVLSLILPRLKAETAAFYDALHGRLIIQPKDL